MPQDRDCSIPFDEVLAGPCQVEKTILNDLLAND